MLAIDIKVRLTGNSSRGMKVLTSAASSGMAQIAMTASSIIAVPIVAAGLGAATYGVYATIVTLPAILSVADFGIGSSVMTKVAEANAVGDTEKSQRLVTSALVSLFLSGLIIVVLGLAMSSYMGIRLWLAADRVPSQGEVHRALMYASLFSAIGVPGGLGARLLLGLQRGWVQGVQLSLTAISSLACLFAVGRWDGHLDTFVAVALGVPACASAILTAYVLLVARTDMRPRISRFSRSESIALLRTGSLFFIIVSAGAFSYQLDTWIVSTQLGGVEAAEFSTAMRLLYMGPLISGFFLTPLWPAFTDAIAVENFAWIKRAFLRSVGGAMLLNGAWCLICALFGSRIIYLWTRGEVAGPSTSLLIALIVWVILVGLAAPLASLLNGAGVMGPQALAALAMTVVNVPCSLSLTRVYGSAGTVWGSVIAQVLIMLPASLFLARRVFTSNHEAASSYRALDGATK